MTAPGNYPVLQSSGLAIIPAAHQTLLSAGIRERVRGATHGVSGPYPAWSNRATIRITNPVNVTGYQHQVTVPWYPGMSFDFRDIRFTQQDGSPCSYWLESYTSKGSAIVWIKVPSANQRQIFLYYGNPLAVSESTGTIFEDFDHFDRATVNPDGENWYALHGTDYATLVDSSLHIYLSGFDTKESQVWGWGKFGDIYSGYALRMRVKPSNIGLSSGWIGRITWGAGQWDWDDSQYRHFFSIPHYDDSNKAVKYYTGAYGSTHYADAMAGVGQSGGMYGNQWCIQQARWPSTDPENYLAPGWVTWTINDKFPVTTSYGPGGPVSLMIYVYSDDGVSALDIDWILLRKCTTTEPICSLVQAGPRPDANKIYYPFVSSIPADLTPERTISGLGIDGSSVTDIETGLINVGTLILTPSALSLLTPSPGERVSVCPLLWNGIGMRVIPVAPVLVLPDVGTSLGIAGSDRISMVPGLAELYLDPDSVTILEPPGGGAGLIFGGNNKTYPPSGDVDLSLHGHAGIAEVVSLALTPSALSRKGGMGGLSFSCSASYAVNNPAPAGTELSLTCWAVQKRVIRF